MKRFDFAADVVKLLITVCTALIAAIVTFYDKFYTKGSVISLLLVIACVLCLIISIHHGISSVGGLTNLVERQEYIESYKTIIDPKKDLVSYTAFIKLGGSPAPIFAIKQQFWFKVALYLLIASFINDQFALSEPKHWYDILACLYKLDCQWR